MDTPLPPNIDPALVSSIVAEIASEKCVLFLGAGLSTGCGLPGWRTLTEDLAKECGCELSDDPLSVTQTYEQRRGRPSLIEKLKMHTDTTGKHPSKVHRILPELRIGTWITTNYDDLLETTLRDASHPYEKICRGVDIPICDWRKTVLVKLHGECNQDSAVVTRDDYYHAQTRNPEIWRWLRVELMKYTFLFIGYGLADPDFDQLYLSLQESLGQGRTRPSYAIMFGIGENKRRDLESHKIQVIDLGNSSGNEATEVLYEFLANIAKQLESFQYHRPEYHKGSEAQRRVPAEVKNQMAADGYELECCIEYHVYSDYLDAGQPMSIPHHWKPPIPREYDIPEYRCYFYTRCDPPYNPKDIWYGWSVGKRRRRNQAPNYPEADSES